MHLLWGVFCCAPAAAASESWQRALTTRALAATVWWFWWCVRELCVGIAKCERFVCFRRKLLPSFDSIMDELFKSLIAAVVGPRRIRPFAQKRPAKNVQTSSSPPPPLFPPWLPLCPPPRCGDGFGFCACRVTHTHAGSERAQSISATKNVADTRLRESTCKRAQITVRPDCESLFCLSERARAHVRPIDLMHNSVCERVRTVHCCARGGRVYGIVKVERTCIYALMCARTNTHHTHAALSPTQPPPVVAAQSKHTHTHTHGSSAESGRHLSAWTRAQPGTV